MVGATTGGLQKGLQGAASAVKGFSGGISNSLAGLGGFIGFGALKAGLKSTAEEMDLVLKSSKTLGISTENLVGLKYAAEQAGVPFATLTNSLFKMEDSLATAATTGKGPAVAALSQLGLKASELINMRPDEAFTVIGDALNGVGNAAQRNALAMDIFGKGAKEIGAVLALGGEGINAATQEAERLGLTFSAIDAEKVDAAGDSIAQMKLAVQGAFQAVAIELAPAISSLASTAAFAFSDAAKSVGHFITVARNEVAFFVGTWALQWELIKVNTAITWDTLKAGAIGTFDAIVAGAVALAKNLVSIYQYIGSTQKALAEGIKAFFTSGFSTEAFTNAFKANLQSMDLKSISGAMGEGFTQGFAGAVDNTLDVKRKKIISDIEGARRTFDDIQADAEKSSVAATAAKPALSTAFKAVESAANVSSNKFAGAAQAGSTEAASAIFGAISAKMGDAKKTEKNTGRTADATERIADAVENLEPAEMDIVEAFA